MKWILQSRNFFYEGLLFCLCLLRAFGIEDIAFSLSPNPVSSARRILAVRDFYANNHPVAS